MTAPSSSEQKPGPPAMPRWPLASVFIAILLAGLTGCYYYGGGHYPGGVHGGVHGGSYGRPHGHYEHHKYKHQKYKHPKYKHAHQHHGGSDDDG